MTKPLARAEKEARTPAVLAVIDTVGKIYREDHQGPTEEEVAEVLGISVKLARQRLGIAARAGHLAKARDRSLPGSIAQFYPLGAAIPEAQRVIAKSRTAEIDRGDLQALKEEILIYIDRVRVEVDDLRAVFYSPATPENYNIYLALRHELVTLSQDLRRTNGDDNPAVKRLGVILQRFPEGAAK